MRIGIAGLGFFLAGALAAGSASAHDMDAIFVKYHMAIRAAETCRGLHFTDRDWRAFSAYIDRRTHFELGAGWRLDLIEGAKSDADLILFYQGCAGERGSALLDLYDRELAPLIG